MNNFILSAQQYDDSGMRRALSAPDFVKVKSKLKTTIKNRMNPLFVKNRPHLPPQSSSPKSGIISNNSNNSNNNDNDEIPTSVLAAAPSLRLKNNHDNEINNNNNPFIASTSPMSPASIIQPQTYQFNPSFNRAHLQSLFLNVPITQSQPYLNSFQLHALIQAAALDSNANAFTQSLHSTASNPLKDHVTSFSMSSLSSNRDHISNHIKRQRTSEPSISQHANSRTLFVPQYGNISHVEEENEMLLANEFKHANKLDEKIQNEFMYGHDDDDEDECADEEEDDDEFDHRLRSYNVYKNQDGHHHHSKHSLKKISCFSDPYLMKSNLQNPNINTSNEELLGNKSNNNRLDNRRSTLNAENEMEFASNVRSAYKYTTGNKA